MEQKGDYFIDASREAIWQMLNDPEILGSCITGCERVNRIDANNFEFFVKARVGPVSARMNVDVQLVELNPPESYVIQGGAKGGAAGFAKGSAEVKLIAEGAGTRLSYSVSANVGGKLAQIGSRLIDGAARKMADDFFDQFSGQFLADLQLEEKDTLDAGIQEMPEALRLDSKKIVMSLFLVVVFLSIGYFLG